MAPGDVLRLAPKTPEWSCPVCLRSGNWASRIKCVCGRPAAAHIISRAKAAQERAKAKVKANSRTAGSTAGTDKGSKALEAANKRIAALEGQLAKAKETPNEEPVVSDEDAEVAELRERQNMLQAMVDQARGKATEAWAATTFGAEIERIKADLRRRKPLPAQQAAMRHRVEKCQKQYDSLCAAASKAEEAADAARAALAQALAEKQAKHTELAALQRQYAEAAAIPTAVQAPMPKFELDPEFVAACGKPDALSAFIETPECKEYTRFLQAQAAGAGGVVAAAAAPEAMDTSAFGAQPQPAPEAQPQVQIPQAPVRGDGLESAAALGQQRTQEQHQQQLQLQQQAADAAAAARVPVPDDDGSPTRMAELASIFRELQQLTEAGKSDEAKLLAERHGILVQKKHWV